MDVVAIVVVVVVAVAAVVAFVAAVACCGGLRLTTRIWSIGWAALGWD